MAQNNTSAQIAGEELSLPEGSKHFAGTARLETNPVQVSV
jgi:hypothetical protein